MTAVDDHGSRPKRLIKREVWLALVLLVIGVSATYIVLGIARIATNQRGVVYTLGKAVSVAEPGIHFSLPWIQRVETIDVTKLRRLELGDDGPSFSNRHDKLILTGNGSLFDVRVVVQYRVSNPTKYFLEVLAQGKKEAGKIRSEADRRVVNIHSEPPDE